MSDKKPEPTQPEKPVHEGSTTTGRLSRAKKAGWITAASSALAILVITLFALVSSKSGSGLIVSIDKKTVDTHFTMGLQPRSGGGGGGSETSDGSGGGGGDQTDERLLIGDPLGKAELVEHSAVIDYYYKKFAEVGYSDGKLFGSWNYIDEQGTPLALFFTFYLNNTSYDEAQPYHIAARLNSELTQAPEAQGRRPYDYVRLGVFLGYDGEPDDTVHYFANANTKRYGTETDPADVRECLAKTGTRTKYEKNEEGKAIEKTWRYPQYSTDWNGEEISFCETFQTGTDGLGLFDIADTIEAGRSRRVTFFTYLEGEDPDTYSDSPINQSLGFSLSIGV